MHKYGWKKDLPDFRVIKTVEKNNEFTEAEGMFSKVWSKLFKGH